MKTVKIHDIEISNKHPFTLIAGPCQIENQAHAEQIAGAIKEV